MSNFSLNETFANIFHETAERGTKSENALVTGSYRQKQKQEKMKTSNLIEILQETKVDVHNTKETWETGLRLIWGEDCKEV